MHAFVVVCGIVFTYNRDWLFLPPSPGEILRAETFSLAFITLSWEEWGAWWISSSGRMAPEWADSAGQTERGGTMYFSQVE